MKKLSTVFVLVLALAGFVSSAGAQGQALTTLPELIVPQSGDLLYTVRPGATPPDFRVQIQNMRSYMIQGLNATCTGANRISAFVAGLATCLPPNIPRVTVATLPASPGVGDVVVITDGLTAVVCDTGGGIANNTCQWNGTAWIPIGGGGGGGGSAHVFRDEGGPALPQRPDVSCVGAGITCADVGGVTEINVPGGPISFAGVSGVASDAQIPNLNILSTGLTASRCVETDAAGLLTVSVGPCVTNFSNLPGIATDAQIPNLNVLSTGLTVNRCVQTDSSGFLSVSAEACGTGGGGGSGTVTSVALSAPAQFSVAGSPVTLTGTLALSWNVQTANQILSGPTSGGAAAPTFRALVAADIPSVPFSILTPATNTSGALVIGSGASLGVSGTGTITPQYAPSGTLAATTVQGAIAELDTETQAALAAQSAALTSGLATKQALDAGLTALAANITNGLWVVTGAGATGVARTITGTTGNVTVTNGDGVAGNPTIDLGATAVQTDQSNTYTTGDQSCANCSSWTAPTATGACPYVSGPICL